MRALLFSGGVDSTCLAWWKRPDLLVYIDYGQIPSVGEYRACKSIARELQLELRRLQVDLRSLGSGSMVGKQQQEGHQPEFWPYRNQMVITLAAMALAGEHCSEIMIGTVKTDRQHPDGRARFLKAMDRLLRSQSETTLVAPAAKLTTGQLIHASGAPPELLGWTFSCHTGEWACGRCRGCHKHLDVTKGLQRTHSRGSVS